MPKATIVKMAGRAGGGGNEFAASCDMRFGVQGKTIINQMEVPLGILPEVWNAAVTAISGPWTGHGDLSRG